MTYYPQADESYDETGIASWYGPNFHLALTANGEIFDMNKVSAAHKTLPLPSVVLVTNLDNGRALKVRVNDRGPFVHGRIIDLSRRAAELLGTKDSGTAKVRVQYLKRESDREVALLQGLPAPGKLDGQPGPTLVAAPAGEVTSQPLSPVDGSLAETPTQPERSRAVQTASRDVVAEQTAPDLPDEPEQVFQLPTPDATDIFVQAGAFSDKSNAERLQTRLTSLGSSAVTPVEVNGQVLYRVRVGPVASVAEGDALLESVIQSGHPNARLVVVD